MGRQTERTHHKGVISELIEAALWTGLSHIRVQIDSEGQLGSETD